MAGDSGLVSSGKLFNKTGTINRPRKNWGSEVISGAFRAKCCKNTDFFSFIHQNSKNTWKFHMTLFPRNVALIGINNYAEHIISKK